MKDSVRNCISEQWSVHIMKTSPANEHSDSDKDWIRMYPRPLIRPSTAEHLIKQILSSTRQASIEQCEANHNCSLNARQTLSRICSLRCSTVLSGISDVIKLISITYTCRYQIIDRCISSGMYSVYLVNGHNIMIHLGNSPSCTIIVNKNTTIIRVSVISHYLYLTRFLDWVIGIFHYIFSKQLDNLLI